MVVNYENRRFVGSAEHPECWIDAKWYFSDREMREAPNPNETFAYLDAGRPFRTLSMGAWDSLDPPGRNFTQTFGLWGGGTLSRLTFPS